MDEQVLSEGADHDDDESSTCGSSIGNEDAVDFTSAFTTDMVFNSREELVEWIRDTGKRNGLVIVIKKSDVGGDGRRPRISFACERSGAYRRKYAEGQTPKRPKTTGTKKCGCPFLLKGHKLDTDDDWMLKVICGVHNHPVTQHVEGHSYAGRLTEQEANILVDLSRSNISPKEILLTLKQRDMHNVSTIKAIYNARHKYKVGEQVGQLHMHQLMDKLMKHTYIEWHRCNEEMDCIKDLFWAHPFAVGLLRSFPRVLIMDCTYKTNMYPFSLLEIIGVTSTELTFSIAFAYLESEREDNYIWALERLRSMMADDALPSVIVTDKDLALMNAVRAVFPSATNLLCRWHISKNVSVHCKNLFETKERWEAFICSWNVLVLSVSEQEYMQHLSAMENDFSRYPQAIDYVKQTWLVNYKEKFVAAWTDLVMHFGNVTMNRAETTHTKLKRLLAAPQGNFETSWARVHCLLEQQHNEIKASFERSSTIVQHNFKAPIFEELRGFVSLNAMNIILSEFERADSVRRSASACGCVFRRTHGLPCAHEIAEYKHERRSIPLSTVDPHWKKLDFVPVTQDTTLELSFRSEIEMFVKRFEETDGPGKLQLLKKLRELTNSISTLNSASASHAEPEVNGWYSSKLDTSNYQDPSEFQYVLSVQDSDSAPLRTSSATSMQLKGRQKEKVYRGRSLQPLSFIDSFPAGLRPYIRDVQDVTPDGHSGFRVVADLMDMGEDNWAQVRRDLVDELQSYYDEYTQLYGGADRAQELLHTLSCFESHAGIEHWMAMPDTGHLIASRYNIVLLLLSQKQCHTFLPLRSVPLPRTSHKIIAIGFINECHYVKVFMHPGSPMAPISSDWFRHRNPCAQGWETPYTAHIRVFRDLMTDYF
ncbi:FAR1-related sequence [Melia azedarach]|nr:FAR1-related sequence [Melia azedarach]